MNTSRQQITPAPTVADALSSLILGGERIGKVDLTKPIVTIPEPVEEVAAPVTAPVTSSAPTETEVAAPAQATELVPAAAQEPETTARAEADAEAISIDAQSFLDDLVRSVEVSSRSVEDVVDELVGDNYAGSTAGSSVSGEWAPPPSTEDILDVGATVTEILDQARSSAQSYLVKVYEEGAHRSEVLLHRAHNEAEAIIDQARSEAETLLAQARARAEFEVTARLKPVINMTDTLHSQVVAILSQASDPDSLRRSLDGYLSEVTALVSVVAAREPDTSSATIAAPSGKPQALVAREAARKGAAKLRAAAASEKSAATSAPSAATTSPKG